MYTDLQTDIRKHTGWVIVLSMLLIVLGVAAIVMPAFASVFLTLVLGWILVFGGIVRIVQSFRSRPVRGFWLNLVVGILYGIAGLVILLNPLRGALTLTAVLATLFVIEGIFTIIMAFRSRPGGQLSWLLVLDGMITLILGILVWSQFPYSALWLIGLYVGISLLMSGVSFLLIALNTRRTLRRV